MKWHTDESTTDLGWEFEAFPLNPVNKFDAAKFVKPILQWAQGYQHPTARTSHNNSYHPDLCSNLFELQACVDFESGDSLRKLFALLLAAAIDAGGTGLLLKLLSVCLRQSTLHRFDYVHLLLLGRQSNGPSHARPVLAARRACGDEGFVARSWGLFWACTSW